MHDVPLEPDTMIGMNAVVMDGATIGATTIVDACAFVKAGYDVPRGVLLAGVPGRVVRGAERRGDRREGERHADLSAVGGGSFEDAQANRRVSGAAADGVSSHAHAARRSCSGSVIGAIVSCFVTGVLRCSCDVANRLRPPVSIGPISDRLRHTSPLA
ncbi:hypothetical protein OEJ37_25695 [Burkholderia sp. BKH01]|nr:hypothetical protein [Burkholderia sp. BKH01]